MNEDTWITVESDRALISGPTFDKLMTKTKQAGDEATVGKIRYLRKHMGSYPWQFGGLAIYGQTAFIVTEEG